ncbi:hypothetical protein M2351_004522 [Azospirillum canadense]|nr:hypothetical protein [Azospirillum canadense]
MTAALLPFPNSPDTGWLPEAPAETPAETLMSSLPSAIVSLARLDRADLRFELGERSPEEIGALAERVEASLSEAAPAIGVDNVLTGIEKLAARFGLDLPDADVLEADIVEMASWPAELWIAGFQGVWASFRSGFRRFPTVGDFRSAAGQGDGVRRVAALRRLATTLRQEQAFRAREIAFRRRQKEREAELAQRQQAAALPAPAERAQEIVRRADIPATPQFSVEARRVPACTGALPGKGSSFPLSIAPARVPDASRSWTFLPRYPASPPSWCRSSSSPPLVTAGSAPSFPTTVPSSPPSRSTSRRPASSSPRWCG